MGAGGAGDDRCTVPVVQPKDVIGTEHELSVNAVTGLGWKSGAAGMLLIAECRPAISFCSGTAYCIASEGTAFS